MKRRVRSAQKRSPYLSRSNSSPFKAAVLAISVIVSVLTMSAGPAFGASLTTLSLSSSTGVASTTARYDWGFKTATTATLASTTMSVPAGTSGANRYLAQPAINGNYAATPDSAANSGTGDTDIRVKVNLPDWTPATASNLVTKYVSTGNQRSYSFRVASTGALEFKWSYDGTNEISALSTTPTGATDGTVKWVRSTLQVNDGSGNRVVKFYVSDDGVSWTQLGSTVTTAGTTSIYDSSAEIEIGNRDGGIEASAGKFYSAEIRSGINGTAVNRFDANLDAAPGVSSWTSSSTSRETWTIDRSGTNLPADVASDLTVASVSGIPSGGTAVLRTIDLLVRYSFTATSVPLNTTAAVGLAGIINTAGTGSYTSTVTTYTATPTAVDTATTPALVISAPIYATPTFVQQNGTGSGSASTTVASAFGSTTTVGNLVVVAYTMDTGATTVANCSDSSGNTYSSAVTQQDTTNNQLAGICYAIVTTAAASTVTVTFGASSTSRGIAIAEYSGVSTTSPLDVTKSQTSTSTGATDNVTSTAATTTMSNELIFGAFENTSSTGGSAAGTTFTGRSSVTVQSAAEFITEDRILATAGSIAATATFANGKRYDAMMATFKPALLAPAANNVLGQGGSYTTSSGAATSQSVNGPTDVAFDPVHHRMFVAEANNNRVTVFNLDSNNNHIDDTADNVLGQAGFTTSGVSLSQSSMNDPESVAYDPVNDRLFVGDQGNRRVLVFNTSSITNGMNAANVLGEPNFGTASANATQNGMSVPTGVAYDSVGNRLFVTDSSNNRTLVYNVASITNGMNASNVLGQSNFTNNSPATTQAGMGQASGVSYDESANYLYVADSSNRRVLVYNLASLSNGMNASFVLGQANFTAAASVTTQSSLKGPAKLDATSSIIYVADRAASRVVGYAKASLANGMNASVLYGQQTYTAAVAAVSQRNLSGPEGVRFDTSSGRITVADTVSNRLLGFNVDQAPDTSASLAQYKSDGTTSVATGGWNNSSTMVFKASVYDGDASDTVKLCVEIELVTVAFNNVATSCGTAVTQGNTASVTVSSLSNGGQYHWQARTVDSTSAYSPWVAFGGNDEVSPADADVSIDSVVPSAPTALAQYKADTITNLSVGAWNDSTTVVFKATVTDTASPVTICVEKKPVGTAFSNTQDACGTAVASGGTASLTIAGLANGTLYHWQARATDSAGNNSAWVSFGGNSDVVTAATDFGIDTTVPTTGSVYDGTSAGVESRYNNGSLSVLSANWSGFADTGGSGITSYTYSIGTSPGATDVLNASNTASTSVTASGLVLRTSQMYYVNVQAKDVAGNVSAVISSPGQLVAPLLTFSVSSSTLTFSRLNQANSFTDSKTLTVTTSTNGYNGYVIRQQSPAPFSTGSSSIAAYGSSYSSPSVWSGTGFGYTSSDANIQGANLFGTGTKYAALTPSGPGDIVADNTSTVSGAPITGEVFTLTYKVATAANQKAGSYTATIVFGATATF